MSITSFYPHHINHIIICIKSVESMPTTYIKCMTQSGLFESMFNILQLLKQMQL